MPRPIHGGDVHAAQRRLGRPVLDFSASLSPLGMPPAVQQAAQAAVAASTPYPDPDCVALRDALARAEGLSPAHVLCGAGAADLLFRLALALRPRRALTLCPTFSEYGAALSLVGCAVETVPLTPRQGFLPDDSLPDAIIPGVELVLLCNPNNPTGRLLPRPLLKAALARCEAVGARLLVDECFVDFVDDPDAVTLRPLLADHPALLLLRSFTKLYAMAGLRLGHILCADPALLERMAECGPPWSVSSVAQAAGLAALRQEAHRAATRALVAAERPVLAQGLRALGCEVVPPDANFVFFRSPLPGLCEALETEGILLRDCASFGGPPGAWYRAAVRTGEENARLLAALAGLLAKNQKEGLC